MEERKPEKSREKRWVQEQKDQQQTLSHAMPHPKLLGGEHSLHCAIPAALKMFAQGSGKMLGFRMSITVQDY